MGIVAGAISELWVVPCVGLMLDSLIDVGECRRVVGDYTQSCFIIESLGASLPGSSLTVTCAWAYLF